MSSLPVRVTFVALVMLALASSFGGNRVCGQVQPSQVDGSTDQVKAQETNRFPEEAEQGAARGNAEDAETQAGSLVVKLQAYSTNVASQWIASLTLVTRQHLAAEEWEAASKSGEIVLWLTRTAYGDDDYRTVDARLTLKHLTKLQELTPEQRQKLRVAETADIQFLQLRQAGRYEEGIKAVSAGLAAREQVLGPNYYLTAYSLIQLANLYYLQGSAATAQPLSERALKIMEDTYGPIHPIVASELERLAWIHQVMGNYRSAEPLCRRALEISEKALGPNDPQTVGNVISLADLYTLMGNVAAAEPLCRRGLKIYEQAHYEPGIARSLHALGSVYFIQGNYAAAQRQWERALKIREKILPPSDPDTAKTLHRLAFVSRAQGDYAAAEPLYERALEIKETAWGPDHPETAGTLAGLGELYLLQGKIAAAERFCRRAVQIYEKNPGSDNLGTAWSQDLLALVYRAKGNYRAAERSGQRALEICEQLFGPDDSLTAQILSDLAETYRLQGNLESAEPLYQRALKSYERDLGPDHPWTAQILDDLAVLYWIHGQEAEARPLCHRGLDIQRAHLEQSAAIQTEQQQFLMTASLAHHLYNWLTVTSVDHSSEAEDWGPVLAWKGMTTRRQIALRRVLRDDPLFAAYRRTAQQLSTLSLHPPSHPLVPNSVAFRRRPEPELLKKWRDERYRLQQEYKSLGRQLAAKSDVFRRDWEQHLTTPAEVVAALQQADRPTALVDLLEYWYWGRKSLNESDEWRIAAFVIRPDRRIQRIDLGAAQPVKEQIISWRRSYGHPTADSNPGRELRKQLWEPLQPHLEGIDTILISPDQELAQIPWGALPGALPDTYLIEERRFAVIPVPQILPELLHRRIRTGPPESLLLVGDVTYGGDPGTPLDLLVQANTSIAQHRGELKDFDPISAAQSELSSIKDWREQVGDAAKINSLRREQATEAAFRREAPKSEWVHVITHGYFAPAEISDLLHRPPPEGFGWMYDKSLRERVSDLLRPALGGGGIGTEPPPRDVVLPGLLSGLAFAGANTPPQAGKDDGVLTALEVTSLDLSNVDTVVLSACDTGLGEPIGGEGLVGLQRAFQVAGAKSVVASLWKVPDAATARLMQRYYENLWDKKMGRLDALREAQLFMLRDKSNRGLAVDEAVAADSDRPLPPYHWAAFVLSGDWR